LLAAHLDNLQHFLASFNELKLLRQLQNCHSPVLGLMLINLSFFKGTLFQNFNQIVMHEPLIMGVQQLCSITVSVA
jgi:hypothetical protein